MPKRVLKTLYKPYKCFVYVPFIGVSTAVCGSLAVVGCSFFDPTRVSQTVGAFWARCNARATPMPVCVEGRENIAEGQSYVVCSNHQSHFDIFVLYGYLNTDIRWVMKQELRKVPFLGLACEKLGHIYIDRSDSSKAVASINAAKDRIKNGTCVVFFPEGTRSQDGKLLRFKKGAFKMALDMGLPILPITINGTKDVLPAKTLDLFPGKARMRIHKPVDTSGYKEADVALLMQRVKDIIASGLDPD